ncbi:MAG: tetratricopeptide (TPR) repeat protein [Myxococcota bacterium]|jgi:tetratricopeptide (TPR) repeat protein
MKTLFPHQKLEWTISHLEEQLVQTPGDPAMRVELARSLLSSGLFHRGGEQACSRALGTARKVLNDDPASVEALVIAGMALVGLERPDAAARYLDQASHIDAERADLRLAMGALEQQHGDLGAAVRNLEGACRLAPDAWEPHMLLGRALMVLARRHNHAKRLVERCQYHLVRALKLKPPPDQLPPMLKDLGVSCMLTGRHREAEKFFIRLREHHEHRIIARYFLGQVAYQLGKYNNAIQHYRQFLRDQPEDPNVLARMAMAWFQLGDYARARQACHQALLIDPENLSARHALGCALLEEGEPNEALRIFRETLREHPDHMGSYLELARTRRLGGDVNWLVQALNVEVRQHDRMPPGGSRDARSLTRRRISVILSELQSVGPSTVSAILSSINHTQDECLRFQLWETASAMAESAVADEAAGRLREPGRYFSPRLGAEALTAAHALPEPVLTSGLLIEESDLKRAAVDRHGPAHDVQEHRRNLVVERNHARAYQSLLLLAISSRRSPAGKALLRSWAETADEDMATAAWAALSAYGEPAAATRLRERAAAVRAERVVEDLLEKSAPQQRSSEPRRISDGEQTRCTTCGRGPGEVTHMMAGGGVVICDRCIIRLWQHRRTLAASDDATCDLCSRSHFEADGLFSYNGVNACSHCVHLSLGLLEREEVDRFLATW